MRPPKKKALEHLHKSLDRARGLKHLRHGNSKFELWHHDTEVVLSNVFGDDSRQNDEFDQVLFFPVIWESRTPESDFQLAYEHGLDVAEKLLLSLIHQIEQFWPEDAMPTIPQNNIYISNPNTNRVFIVHGRDEGIKDSTARFLTDLQLDAVVLQEMPNQGRTIIEKFEDYSDVGFAVVLFTPDDVGGLAGDQRHVKPRTRQNVIFELGFFLGRLGRNRVAVLVKNGVEIPSDYSGVLFIPLDDRGAWKMQLMGELKSAGFPVDANLAFNS